jgi:hypothetical protein
MPNLSTLAGRLLTQELGSEDSTVLFTDARREAAVNDGLREFADLTNCLVRVATITVTGGTAEYDLASTTYGGDFARLSPDQSVAFVYTSSNSTQVVAGDDLPERSVRWLDTYRPGWRADLASSGANLPEFYYMRTEGASRPIGFVPTPSTSPGGSAQALVPYIAQSPIITSTQQPYTFNGVFRTDLKPYHQAAVHYAAHQLEKLRRDNEASDRQLQKFQGYVARYLQSMRRVGGSALNYSRRYFRRGPSWTAEDPRT